MFLRRGHAPKTRLAVLNIGKLIKLNVGGAQVGFLVVQQGLPSDAYDESCNGTWLLAQNIYEKLAWNSANSKNYPLSDINQYLNEDFYDLLGAEVQERLKQVKIPYRYKEDYSGAEGMPCRVFLPSVAEVGVSGNYRPVEGATLSYFERFSDRVAYYDGKAFGWWTRSSTTQGSGNTNWFVTSSGATGTSNGTSATGIRPLLIMDSEAIVIDNVLV